MKALQHLAILFLILTGLQVQARPVTPPVNQRYLALSEQLLYHVKSETPTDTLERLLATLNLPDLVYGLSDDKARKTFWINIYNAWFQILATREQKTRPAIFTNKLVNIGGTLFSLDDIEHGILRHYRAKLSQGYREQPNTPVIIKQLAVAELDYRIHFALNCGAKSCPPIAFYKYERLDDQLNLASASFLSSETKVNEGLKELTTSKILFYYEGDFGGKPGILKMLSKYLNQNFTGYKIKYADYNWDARLKNFNDGF